MTIHVPREYTAERPAVRFSHLKFDVCIEEHPLACRLPKKTGESPSVQEDCHTFRSFSVPQDLPNNIEHYFNTDEPLVSLQITTFVNATLVSTTFPHSVSDVMGTADFVKAWSSVLADRFDRIPTVLGVSEDVIKSAGTSLDEESKVPYVLQDKQIKGFSFLVFAVRFAWDLLTRRNIQKRIVFLPATFLSQIRQTAQRQLGLGSENKSTTFVSDGDLITAWFSRMVIASRSRKRPAVICNVFDLRNRLSSTFIPGATYLQNLILPTSVILPATKVSTAPFGEIALQLRQAIVEQATDTQARSLMRLFRASHASTGLMPIFGNSDTMVIACTNWSKARFFEGINFGPAVVSIDHSIAGEILATKPGACVSYWGSTIGSTDNPRDTFIIYGKDGEGNYWLHGYFRPETWGLIQDAFLERSWQHA